MGEYFENMRFVNPELLWLLLLIPVAGLWYWWQHRNYFVALKMPSLAFASELTTMRSKLRILVPLSRAVAYALMVIAFARPQTETQRERIEGEGIDIVLAMDVSSSMLIEDFIPNRLEVSKRVASKFIDKRKFDRIGLTAFAGEAMTQCPVTTDHYALKNFLYNLRPGKVQDGTAIGLGLAAAVNRLQVSTAKSKIVILLTDGVNTMGWVDPLKAAQIAQSLGVKVYTIGMGMPTHLKTTKNIGGLSVRLNLDKVDEKLLRKIAKITGGIYFQATQENRLEKIYEEIDRLEKSSYEMTSFRKYRDSFFGFALAGIFFILLEIILSQTVFQRIP
ncbi:MAG TPA: VWA domain-containing protein [Saprospiraceae bacterium]|nr:VWA domain-containing protein [Saprospiraceae bacterium]